MPSFALLAPLGESGAQVEDAVMLDCDYEAVQRLTPDAIGARWLPHHPDSVFLRLADPLRQDAWSAVFDSLTRHAGDVVGLLEPRVREQLVAELDSLAPFFGRAERDPGERELGQAPVARWQLQGDPERPAYELFRGRATRIRVDDGTPRDGRRAVCWTAMTVRRVLTFFNDPGRERVVARLNELAGLWDSYLTNSYSQLPWELWLNGALPLGRRLLAPPRRQVVLIHPSAAIEVRGGDYPDWNRIDAATLEMVGMLRYNGRRTSYVGASVVASITPDAPLGFGPLLHAGKAVKVGYVFRRRADDGSRQDGVAVSVDVYRFLVGVPEHLRERKLDALRDQLACLRLPSSCPESTTVDGSVEDGGTP